MRGMYKLSLVFVASGLGGMARYLLAGWVQRFPSEVFPVGTLVVNLTGCAAIGFLAAVAGGRLGLPEEYRVALAAGLLGGFTTFSTFGLETFALFSTGQAARACLNVGLSIVGGLLAVWAGFSLGRLLAGS